MRAGGRLIMFKVWVACIVSGLFVLLCLPLMIATAKGEEDLRVSVIDFGALPDGQSDSTAAINRAVAFAKLHNGIAYVPKGVFVHRSFSLDGVALIGAGQDSVLLAPNPEDASIYLRGAKPSLRDLSVEVHSSRRDTRNPAVFIDHATGFVVEGVSVEGGNQGGIFDFGGSYGRIVNNRVQDTLADAIHNTYGAHDIIVAGNFVRRSGDDMIAVVSYGNEILCHDILIENNDLADQRWGRGISVVGGERVTIRNNSISQTNCCAGIYVAAESAYKTHSVHDILVQDNLLVDTSGSTGHGAIMIFADRGSVRDVRIERNMIQRPRHSGVRLRGAVAQIELIDNQIVDPHGPGFTSDGARAYCIGNLVNNAAVTPSFCNVGGNLRVTGALLDAGSQNGVAH